MTTYVFIRTVDSSVGTTKKIFLSEDKDKLDKVRKEYEAAENAKHFKKELSPITSTDMNMYDLSLWIIDSLKGTEYKVTQEGYLYGSDDVYLITTRMNKEI